MPKKIVNTVAFLILSTILTAALDKLAGARGTVKGSVAGDVVSVTSVTPAAKKAAQYR